jgi:diguanylate cyclase (GGDEF)-like protein
MKSSNENISKLYQIFTNEAFTSSFISGLAGDCIQSDEDKILYDRLLQKSDGDFYVKLLFFITHEIFEKKRAKKIWEEVLNHKDYLSDKLKRNVEITVATLDYLTNITNELNNPKIIGESFIGKIAEISSLDYLTKLFNREFLNSILNTEFLRYTRYGATFSIIVIDIDKFKLINDNFGHQVGDEILVRISSLFRDALRELDTCARYGGEEFLIVLPHTDISQATDIANRIKSDIKRFYESSYKLTISAGVANCPTSATNLEKLIKIADMALYASKNNGRDLVTAL